MAGLLKRTVDALKDLTLVFKESETKECTRERKVVVVHFVWVASFLFSVYALAVVGKFGLPFTSVGGKLPKLAGILESESPGYGYAAYRVLLGTILAFLVLHLYRIYLSMLLIDHDEEFHEKFLRRLSKGWRWIEVLVRLSVLGCLLAFVEKRQLDQGVRFYCALLGWDLFFAVAQSRAEVPGKRLSGFLNYLLNVKEKSYRRTASFTYADVTGLVAFAIVKWLAARPDEITPGVIAVGVLFLCLVMAGLLLWELLVKLKGGVPHVCHDVCVRHGVGGGHGAVPGAALEKNEEPGPARLEGVAGGPLPNPVG